MVFNSQPQSHISVFISNCLWQSVEAVLSSRSWSCVPLPYSLPVGLWLDQSVNKYHTPGTAGLCLQSGDWGRVLFKYCLNSFSCSIPLSWAFPRAKFVPDCQDAGKDFVWLAKAWWKEKGSKVLKSLWQRPYGSWVCGHIIMTQKLALSLCLCVYFMRIGLYMYAC